MQDSIYCTILFPNNKKWALWEMEQIVDKYNRHIFSVLFAPVDLILSNEGEL